MREGGVADADDACWLVSNDIQRHGVDVRVGSYGYGSLRRGRLVGASGSSCSGTCRKGGGLWCVGIPGNKATRDAMTGTV